MNIGIFLEKFTQTELTKDPGLIASGLVKEGTTVKIFAHFAVPEVSLFFITNLLSRNQRNRPEYWQTSGIDCLIIYSWLSLRYSGLISAAKTAGLKVILKLDSDGYLIYPHQPSYLKVFGLDDSLRAKIYHFIRIAQWLFLTRIMSKKKIDQIQASDAVIIETPVAAENLKQSLRHWQHEDLANKINVIPNPITDWPEEVGPKKNMVTAIGRWNDNRKNASALMKTLSTLESNWQIRLIGQGATNLSLKILEHNPRAKIESFEKLPHAEIFKTLTETKIIFAPSIAESYNLAVAEGLCCGCSFVGGPLPSFQYFAHEGQSGRITSDLKAETFVRALKTEISKWDNHGYNSQQIASFWRQEIGLPRISQKIIDLINYL